MSEFVQLEQNVLIVGVTEEECCVDQQCQERPPEDDQGNSKEP